MKRIIFALVLVAALATSMFASASALPVSGGAIQAGVDSTLYCDADGVQVTGWALETNDNSVYFVTIGGIDTKCAGNNMHLRVFDTNGTALGEAISQVLTASGTARVTFPASARPTPEQIGSIKVWIDGAAGQ